MIYMKKFLNSDWLRAVQFFRNTDLPKNEIQCKKRNNTKNKIKNINYFHVTYACDCMIFSCILLISNSMVSCAIWKTYTLNDNVHSWVSQRLQIALVLRLRTRAISIVFEKLTRAYFFQIAHETILLPIQITKITKLPIEITKLLNYQITKIYRLLAVVLLVLFIKQNGVGILLQRRHWRRRTNRTHSQLRLVCDWPTQIFRRKKSLKLKIFNF